MIKETKNIIGNNLHINDSEEEYLEKINIIGNKLVQEGEPSLANPSELKYVGGNYDIEVSNNDESKKQIYPLDLSNRNLLNYQDFTFIGSGFIINNLSLPLSRGKYVFSFDFAGIEASAELGTAVTSKTFTVRNGRNILFYDNIDSSEVLTFYSNGPGTYSNFMLTKGTQELSYQPYVTPYNYPLYSENDYIYKKDNKWYVHNEFDRYDFTGLEGWGKHETTNNNAFYLPPAINPIKDKMKIPENPTTVLEIYSNRLLTDNLTNTVFQNQSSISFSSIGYIYISTTLNGISTIDAFKTFLKNNSTYMIYPLATPTETEITDSLLISQLQTIENIYTYKGITHININGSEILPLLDITYVSNIEEYDFYITKNNRFIIKDKNINQIYSPQESEIPDIAEATESTVKIAGKDGDLVLATKYEPLEFKLVTYSEENLELEEKIKEQSKIISFLNSIKNETKKIAFLDTERMIDVKYYNKLQTIKYPKSLRFEIPLKSSNSYSTELKKKKIIGNNEKNSDTIENTGCIITIKGPASTPTIALNDYQIIYYNELLAGNKLVIDTGNSTITHITSKGIETNAAIYYNHEYPKIKNGTNELKIQSGIENPNQVSVEWFDLKN